MRKFIVFLLIFFAMPVFAGEFEDAFRSGKDVMVYFYSSTCSTCKKFNPYYDGLAKEHKELKCIKINIDNSYGYNLFRKYHGTYVPYLILTGSKAKKTVSIPMNCAINNMCLNRVVKDLSSGKHG